MNCWRYHGPPANFPVVPEYFQPPNGWALDERTGRRSARGSRSIPDSIRSNHVSDLVLVLGEEASTESVIAVVGLRNPFLEARDRVDSNEREEVLVRRERVIVRNVRDHGRLDVPAGREVFSVDAAPASRDRAVRGRRFTDIVVALSIALSSIRGETTVSRFSGLPMERSFVSRRRVAP